jgi:hypothetical protein
MTDTITVKEHRLQWSPGKITNYVDSYVQYLYAYYISPLRVFRHILYCIYIYKLVFIGKYKLFAKAKY